jgi:predicted HTH domain antitoxin
MNLKELKVRVPKELRGEEVAIALAVELYREGKLTLKQASDLADFCVEDFMKILSERRVSVINWDEEELEKEMKNANSF